MKTIVIHNNTEYVIDLSNLIHEDTLSNTLPNHVSNDMSNVNHKFSNATIADLRCNFAAYQQFISEFTIKFSKKLSTELLLEFDQKCVKFINSFGLID